jgi:hypothetical protein
VVEENLCTCIYVLIYTKKKKMEAMRGIGWMFGGYLLG